MINNKLTDKYNHSCIKVFTFLEKLYEGDVDFNWVINLFSEGHYDGTSNTHVTINKYMNALKVFGVKIRKIKHKYRMYVPIYKLKLDLGDIKSVNIMKEACNQLPEGKNRTACEEFLHAIEMRYDIAARSIVEVSNNTKNLDLKFYHAEMVEQMKMCEQYCQDKLKLDMIYFDEKGREVNLICSPLEQIYLKRKIYFKVLSSNGDRIYEIPIDNIKSIRQLPNAATTVAVPMTIVFRIKGRLAKNYKMREWERLEKIEADGSRIIVNKDEDLNQLIKRLMRYGKDCEIISPKFFKEEMIELINKTLSNYQ